MRGSLRLNAQDKTGFPDGFDAVDAAPQSHKVLFENAIVRVLQVEVAPGTKEPMHHHRWPSIFVIWDTGGRTGHIRILSRGWKCSRCPEPRNAGYAWLVARHLVEAGTDAFD